MRIRATSGTIADPPPAVTPSFRAVLRAGAILCAMLSCSLPVTAARPAGAPWVAISDLHFGPNFSGPPSPLGDDTNPALLNSLFDELRRRDPHPPVVTITGDFLAHSFDRRTAADTMVLLAHRFDALYPHAQFLIALGNNDSACGDYAAPVDGPFLAATAKAWAPLVNRHGAAPGFAKTFAHDGSYVARLPVPGLRAIVVNDVSFAIRANDGCAAGLNPRAATLGDLSRALRSAPPHSHAWLLLHIPPGIDAYSTTHLAHRLAVIPFMRPNVREALEAQLGDPKNAISLVLAGHTHKFGYRLSSGATRVPILLVPSVSPIFGNGPSFLELGVGASGTIGTVREISYGKGRWKPIGAFSSIGIRAFDGAQLAAAQRRLASDSRARDVFSRLYSGGGPAEITEGNWQSYWCAATAFSASAFQRCDDQHGLGILRPRAIKLIALCAGIVLLAGAVLFFAFRFEARHRRA